MTFVLGLTGSIGMGKSTTAEMLRRAGLPVYDADATVHRLYAGPAASSIEAAFPGSVEDGVVNRARLGAMVLGDPARLRQLEAIVHPLVRREEERFLADQAAAGAPIVVLDIPLLYETGGEARCDAVLLVTATPETQRDRVLARPGMNPEKFAALLAQQMPDAEKRRRAQFHVDTGQGLAAAEHQVRAILQALSGRPGTVLAGRPSIRT